MLLSSSLMSTSVRLVRSGIPLSALRFVLQYIQDSIETIVARHSSSCAKGSEKWTSAVQSLLYCICRTKTTDAKSKLVAQEIMRILVQNGQSFHVSASFDVFVTQGIASSLGVEHGIVFPHSFVHPNVAVVMDYPHKILCVSEGISLISCFASIASATPSDVGHLRSTAMTAIRARSKALHDCNVRVIVCSQGVEPDICECLHEHGLMTLFGVPQPTFHRIVYGSGCVAATAAAFSSAPLESLRLGTSSTSSVIFHPGRVRVRIVPDVPCVTFIAEGPTLQSRLGLHASVRETLNSLSFMQKDCLVTCAGSGIMESHVRSDLETAECPPCVDIDKDVFRHVLDSLAESFDVCARTLFENACDDKMKSSVAFLKYRASWLKGEFRGVAPTANGDGMPVVDLSDVKRSVFQTSLAVCLRFLTDQAALVPPMCDLHADPTEKTTCTPDRCGESPAEGIHEDRDSRNVGDERFADDDEDYGDEQQQQRWLDVAPMHGFSAPVSASRRPNILFDDGQRHSRSGKRKGKMAEAQFYSIEERKKRRSDGNGSMPS
eukprot:ANDGO_04807.mRNA.1 hypothetical protein